MARVFISHATADTALAVEVQRWLIAEEHDTFLDRDLGAGIRLGEEWELRLYERLRWADAMVCVVTPAYVASTWCAAEVGIARSQGARLLPVRAEPSTAHPLLASVQQVDWADGRAELARALRLVDHVGGLGWSDDREPYPGLRPFTPEQHRVFFGRGTEVEELAGRLRSPAHQADAAVLLVVGPSGSGKSSLVRAGLLPAVGAEPDWWTVAPFVPGTDPVGALARELAAGARELGVGWSIADVRARLEAHGLADVVDELLLAVPGARRHHLLVVVDQFEELITQTAAAERAAFAGLLRPALGGQAAVVATLRPEFLDQVLLDPALAGLPTSAYPLRPLPPEALRSVVEGPARVAGIEIDDDLVTRLVADTEGGEALPLLAYTLAELARGVGRGGRLLVSRYEELGGVQGAITRQADAALGEAVRVGGRDGPQVIRELLRLVTVDEQGRPTRWRVDRGDLPAGVVGEFAPFVERRLLTTDRDDGATVVGVAHEAFLSAWRPLAEAIGHAAAALRARRQIEQAAAAWVEDHRAPERLWERGQLASALSDTGAHFRSRRRVVVTERVDLNPIGREFLTASSRRDRFRRRRATTVLSLLLGLSLVAAGVAYVQQRAATHQQAVATARQLAATAVANRDTHLDLAQLLAVAGYRRDPDPQTRAALFSATTASPQLVRYLHAGSPVSALAASRDGTVLLAGTEGGTVSRWDLRESRSGQEVVRFDGKVSSVALSRDGALVAATDGARVIEWDAQRDGGPSTVELAAGLTADAVGVSPGGRWLAVVGHDRSLGPDASTMLVVVDLRNRASSTVDVGPMLVGRLAFPDENQIVLVDEAYGTWRRLTLSPLATVVTSDQGLAGAHDYGAGVSPDGDYFTWTNASREIPVWTTAAAADPDRPDRVALGPGRSPEALAVSSGGDLVAVADTGSIYLSRTAASVDSVETLGVLTGSSSVNVGGLVFAGDDGRQLVSATGESLALWDLGQLNRIGEAEPVPVPDVCNACPAPEVVVSPDGRGVAIRDGGNGTVAVTASPRATNRSEQSLRFLSLSGTDESFGTVLWTDDSARLLVRVPESATVSVSVGAPDGPVVQTVRGPSGEEEVSLDPPSPGDPAIVLRPAHGRPADGAESAMARASRLLGEALRTRSDEHPQAGPVVLDATRSTAASVVTTFTPDGDVRGDVWLVSMSRGTAARLPVDDAMEVAFSRDRLLISLEAGPLEIRDRSGRHLLAVAPGSPTDTVGLAASATSDLAARLRRDGTIVLLDVTSGAVLGSLGDPAQVWYGMTPGLAFTPDGRDLFVASPYEPSTAGTGELRQFVTASDQWVRIACRTAGRDLTADEWRQYVNESVPSDLSCAGSG